MQGLKSFIARPLYFVLPRKKKEKQKTKKSNKMFNIKINFLLQLLNIYVHTMSCGRLSVCLSICPSVHFSNCSMLIPNNCLLYVSDSFLASYQLQTLDQNHMVSCSVAQHFRSKAPLLPHPPSVGIKRITFAECNATNW